MRNPALSHMPFPVLASYGWTSARADQLPAGTHPARVVRYDGAALLAVTRDGPRTLRASPGLDPLPTVGDWLAVGEHPDGHPDDARIVQVLARTSLLRRMAADGSGFQALAANVDVVLIACGMDRPVRAGRIHRAAAQAWDADAHPVLLLTKAGAPGAADVDLPRLELEHPGMRVLVTSAQEGAGLDEVRAVVAGRTAVLVGESGAGKSTLINAMLGRDEVATGAVREGDAKGRHTTTARQLHVLPAPGGGCIIDTPGIRSLGLFTDAGAVDATFGDIQELAGSCRFSDCGHLSEPGCAVLAACDSGALAQGRYDSWRQLQREAASAAMRSSPHELRKHGKRFSRAAREGSEIKRGAGDGRRR
jgi:ribosome biogenesis GTPase / thiamine phosphate phosphatase